MKRRLEKSILSIILCFMLVLPMTAVGMPEVSAAEADENEDGFVNKEGKLVESVGSAPTVEIPTNMISIGEETFADCNYFDENGNCAEFYSIRGAATDGEAHVSDFFVVNENGVLISYAGDAGGVEIPEGIATEIGAWTFYGREDLTSITIPEGVTSIGEAAFYGCSNLTEVSLPSTLTEIEKNAFNRCKSLREIAVPSNVTSIGSGAFAGCSELEKVTLEYGLNSIGAEAFITCIKLSEITIPSSVCDIGDYAFDNCWSLTVLMLPDGVMNIGSYAFNACKNLSVVSIPPSVKSIGYHAFGIRGEFLVLLVEMDSYADKYAEELKIPSIARVNDKTPTRFISDCEISAIAPQTYTSETICPKVRVTYNGEQLQEDEDYILTYSNNIKAGEDARVFVIGEGEYTGVVTKTFTIKKAFQNIKHAKSYAKAYGGSPFWINTETVCYGEYGGSLSYSSSNKNVATVNSNGKVTIKGTGTSTLTVTAAETSNHKKTSIKITLTVSPKKQTLTNLKTAKGRKLTVKWKKDARATGYQIQYSTKNNFSGAKTVNIGKNTTTSKTLTKLTKGKKYYVRIRSYKTAKVNGKTTKLYGTWSSAKRSGSIKK